MTERVRLPAVGRAMGAPEPDTEEDSLNLEAGILIRDMRTNERFWTHDCLIDDYGPLLGPDAFTIYASLCLMANKAQYCWPSLARLARHWSKGKTTVSRAVTLLTDFGLIYVKRSRREDGGDSNNIYYLLEPLPFPEGAAHLLAALQQRGQTSDEAASYAANLLAENWEPLRTKKAALKNRADWLSLVEDTIARSSLGREGPGAKLGGSWDGTGGPEMEPGVLTGSGWGPGVERHGLPQNPGGVAAGMGPVPQGDSKGNPHQGNLKKDAQEGNHHQGAGGVLLHSDEEIIGYPLGEEEVFIEAGVDGAEPIRLRELVRRDILATEQNWNIAVRTECFYSAEQFLGLAGEEWTPLEERKRAYHGALGRDLHTTYKEIGAFSVEEALGALFTRDLVERLRPPDSDEEQRVRGWLAYVYGEAGKGLDNPAGFLRSRIEAGQWPPRGVARRHGRGE